MIDEKQSTTHFDRNQFIICPNCFKKKISQITLCRENNDVSCKTSCSCSNDIIVLDLNNVLYQLTKPKHNHLLGRA